LEMITQQEKSDPVLSITFDVSIGDW
jgi:hypothetical protein